MTRFIAGPYCTMLLADNGANVIKIEPIGGEVTRSIAPQLESNGGSISVYFARFNRNKRSVCVDMKTTRGRDVFRQLVRRADVLVENFRPEILARLGFSSSALQEINTRLVYCSISGFGHASSPYRDRPAFAPVVEALSGVVRLNPLSGEPPLTMGIPIGDMFPGALAVVAITMALLERERTGQGTHIDMAMYDAMLSFNERVLALTAMLDIDICPGSPTMRATPSGIFRAADGYISLSVVGEQIWERFCHAIGHEELLSDPRLTDAPSRADLFEDVLLPIIDAWLRRRSCHDAVKELLESGVPAAEVLNAHDVLESEQAHARNMIVRVPTYAGIEVQVPGNPIRMGAPRPVRLEPMPAPGEHTVEVLRDLLEYEAVEIDSLLKDNVVASWPAHA